INLTVTETRCRESSERLELQVPKPRPGVSGLILRRPAAALFPYANTACYLDDRPPLARAGRRGAGRRQGRVRPGYGAGRRSDRQARRGEKNLRDRATARPAAPVTPTPAPALPGRDPLRRMPLAT